MMKALAFLLAAPLAAAAAAVAAPPSIGVASAVRGAVKATAPGAAGRVVETGKPVYSRDKVTTGPEGKLQILLLDQTSFTIGANSELELDEFVFDPATNAGKVSAKIAKGAFRFVTGKVARRDPSSMRVTTPVGTIGIRGTMTAGTVSGSEATIVLLGPGPENNADEKSGGITVKNDKGSTEIDKDGWGVTVKAGEAPGKPFELSAGQLETLLGAVGSAPTGGSKDDAAGGDSTDKSSGQGTAEGKETSDDAFAALDASQGDVSQFASQQFSAPKVSKWSDVIAIPGGGGKYVASGSYYNCTGGTCSSTPAGTVTYAIDINFGAKTLGGGSSNITLTAPASITGNISSPISYASLTGDAKLTFVQGSTIFSAAGNFNGTSIKLLDAGGVTAGAASVDLKAFDTSAPGTIYGGELGSTLQP